MWRMGEVWINLKGREVHDGIEGIVEPGEEQWLLEEEIMTRILETKSPLTGMRVCTLALRNKDAVLLGMGGPKCGDIIYLAAEGYTMDHADSFSTVEGACGTSCMSIFAAAGPRHQRKLQDQACSSSCRCDADDCRFVWYPRTA